MLTTGCIAGLVGVHPQYDPRIRDRKPRERLRRTRGDSLVAKECEPGTSAAENSYGETPINLYFTLKPIMKTIHNKII
jgi:hypothetical protein